MSAERDAPPRLSMLEMGDRFDKAWRLVQVQAADDGLWFHARHVTEAYLQQELRRLHAVIEGDRSWLGASDQFDIYSDEVIRRTGGPAAVPTAASRPIVLRHRASGPPPHADWCFWSAHHAMIEYLEGEITIRNRQIESLLMENNALKEKTVS